MGREVYPDRNGSGVSGSPALPARARAMAGPDRFRPTKRKYSRGFHL